MKQIFVETPQEPPPKRLWVIKLRGHIDEVELAAQAIQENQKEVFSNQVTSSSDSDDDEITVELFLELKDPVMVTLVELIITQDHPYVTIEMNAEKKNERQI